MDPIAPWHQVEAPSQNASARLTRSRGRLFGGFLWPSSVDFEATDFEVKDLAWVLFRSFFGVVGLGLRQFSCSWKANMWCVLQSGWSEEYIHVPLSCPSSLRLHSSKSLQQAEFQLWPEEFHPLSRWLTVEWFHALSDAYKKIFVPQTSWFEIVPSQAQSHDMSDSGSLCLKRLNRGHLTIMTIISRAEIVLHHLLSHCHENNLNRLDLLLRQNEFLLNGSTRHRKALKAETPATVTSSKKELGEFPDLPEIPKEETFGQPPSWNLRLSQNVRLRGIPHLQQSFHRSKWFKWSFE